MMGGGVATILEVPIFSTAVTQWPQILFSVDLSSFNDDQQSGYFKFCAQSSF